MRQDAVINTFQSYNSSIKTNRYIPDITVTTKFQSYNSSIKTLKRKYENLP